MWKTLGTGCWMWSSCVALLPLKNLFVLCRCSFAGVSDTLDRISHVQSVGGCRSLVKSQHGTA